MPKFSSVRFFKVFARTSNQTRVFGDRICRNTTRTEGTGSVGSVLVKNGFEPSNLSSKNLRKYRAMRGKRPGNTIQGWVLIAANSGSRAVGTNGNRGPAGRHPKHDQNRHVGGLYPGPISYPTSL